MKDLLEKLLAYIPAYLSELTALSSGPKRFMAARNTGDRADLNNALAFLGISVSLAFLLQAPLVDPEKDLWMTFSSLLVHTLLGVVVFSAVLRLSWYAVGGRATLDRFLVTYSYYAALVVIVVTLAVLCGDGVIRTFDADLHKALRSGDQTVIQKEDPFGSMAFLVGWGLVASGIVFAGVWGFIGWGAYRQLNGLSRLRSAVAFIIAGLLTWPATAAIFFVGRALD